ncbi:MAG: isoaspartyl peptidase/L-asparaginase [Limisphaerales bacterium]
MPKKKTQPVIVVHGGAWDIPKASWPEHIEGCRKGCETGLEVLQSGGSALDAVEVAVRQLETDPTFDAGCGSFLNEEGEVELDASIMDGATLKAGAVAAVRRMLHPVTLARKIMEKTDHLLLVGTGAEKFARKMGMKFCLTAALLTGRELALWKKLKAKKKFSAKSVFSGHPKGTVGAVALDSKGSLAAATSTGGTPRKMAGRVGDTPIIWAGTYADNLLGAVSCSGWGEGIMRIGLARLVLVHLQNGLSPAAAVKKAVEEMRKRVDGYGGAILVTPQGRVGLYYNTPRMAFAYSDKTGAIKAGIKR